MLKDHRTIEKPLILLYFEINETVALSISMDGVITRKNQTSLVDNNTCRDVEFVIQIVAHQRLYCTGDQTQEDMSTALQIGCLEVFKVVHEYIDQDLTIPHCQDVILFISTCFLNHLEIF